LFLFIIVGFFFSIKLIDFIIQSIFNYFMFS